MRAGSGTDVICGHDLEIIMTPDDVRKLVVLSRQLTENLMSAALCAKEFSTIVCSETSDYRDGKAVANGNCQYPKPVQDHSRPLMDESTLSVIWQGKTRHLGHTQGYWLLARLARRVNQYVTHLDLLREIWDDEFADTSLLRSGVQRLRAKLRDGGMADLARAITGHHGRYMLDLSLISRHADVTAVSHRTSQT